MPHSPYDCRLQRSAFEAFPAFSTHVDSLLSGDSLMCDEGGAYIIDEGHIHHGAKDAILDPLCHILTLHALQKAHIEVFGLRGIPPVGCTVHACVSIDNLWTQMLQWLGRDLLACCARQ